MAELLYPKLKEHPRTVLNLKSVSSKVDSSAGSAHNKSLQYKNWQSKQTTLFEW
jgi:hypothetical protein